MVDSGAHIVEGMTTPALPWLPDRHLGVAATLAHADELIEEVGELLFQYLAQDADVVRLKEVPNGLTSRTVVESVAPIPRKVPLLVADALVALRGALEHVLFTEVEFLNGEPLDEKAARVIEMPARTTFDDFEEWVRKRGRNAPASLHPGSELVRRVSGLQPFHRNIRPDLHPLARLTSHTNHAKHRTPAITAVRLVAMIRDDEVPRSLSELPRRPEEPLLVGHVLADTPVGVQVPTTLFPTVGINRPGTDEWPILMHELDEISLWVRTQALPRLITGGDPPEALLPTRYEIGVGHPDERFAISLGSHITANERNKARMGAASARDSLVELLHPESDELSPQEIAAWLEQLDDDEVLKRVTRLKSTFNYEPSIVVGNLVVVQELLSEVTTFTAAQRQS